MMKIRFKILICLGIVAQLLSQPAFGQKLLDPAATGGPLSMVSSSLFNVNTTVTLAYSVRQLKTIYDHVAVTPPTAVGGFSNSTAPLIRVRRSFDSAQLDIGYTVYGLLDTVMVKNFVSNNGTNPTASGFVSVWFDQSGNSRDAVQPTLSLQPRIVNAGVLEKNENNIPAVVDQGGLSIADTASVSKPYGITGDHTISIMGQPKAFTVSGTGDGGGTYFNDRLGHSTYSLSSIKLVVGGYWAAQIRTDANTGIVSSPVGTVVASTTRTDAVTLVRTADNYPLYVNGIQVATASISGANTPVNFQLGYGTNSSQNVCFVEAIIFPSALSVTNLSTLYGSQGSFAKPTFGRGKLLDATSTAGPLSIITASSAGVNTSVSLGYSTRQLKTIYDHTTITAPAAVSGFTNSSTPLLRVRRSIDDGQLDIGYDSYGTLDTVTLKNFVSNNGASPTASGYVSVWYDQSGNSRDAKQSVNASQPRIVDAGTIERNENGIPAVVDYGDKSLYDSVSFTTPYNITGDRTVSFIAQPKIYTNGALGSGNGSYLIDRNQFGNGLTSIKIIGDKWAGQIRTDVNTGIASSPIGTTTVSTTRTDAVVIVRTGNNYPLYVNGTQVGTASISGANTLAPIRIGYASNGATSKVYFEECVIFPSALSTLDLASLYNNQNAWFKQSQAKSKLLDNASFGGPLSVAQSSAGNANTSIAVAYSMRQLKSYYDHAYITPPTAVAGFSNSAEPLIRVRRSNDNAELDIGYDYNGNLDTVRLKAFVSTNSGYISVWYDQSGNNRDAKQTATASQPRIVNAGVVEVNSYGVPGIVTLNGTYINEGGAMVSSPNGVNRYGITGNRTLNAVCHPRAYTNGLSNDGAGTYIFDRVGGGLQDAPLTSIKASNNKWSLQIRNDAGTISSSFAGTINISTGRSDNITVIRNADVYSMEVDGVFAGSGTLSGINSMAPLKIGYGSNTGENIYFGEVLLFGSALSASDRVAINGSQERAFRLGDFPIWTGAVGTDWTTAGNWNTNLIPSEVSTVTIPAGTTNKPFITAAQTTLQAKRLTIDSTTFITIAGNLSISDSVTARGGVYATGSGTFTLNGTSKQYIKGYLSGAVNNNVSDTIYAFGDILLLSGELTNPTTGKMSMTVYNLGAYGGTSINNSGYISTASITAGALPAGKTWGGTVAYTSLTGGQQIVQGTYNNLQLRNTSGTNTLGNSSFVNGILTTTSGGTFDLASFALRGTPTSVINNGTIKASFPANVIPPIPADISWGGTGTVIYARTSGGQYISPGTYNNLTLLNTSGTNTAFNSNTVKVLGTFTTTAGGTLDMGQSALTDSTGTTISHSGTIQTANVSSTPLPSGKTWGGSIVYNAPTGGQSIVAGNYDTLTFANSSGTQTVGGTIVVSRVLTNSLGSILSMGSNVLSGAGTFTNEGTITTTNTSGAPIPTGKTWGGTISYNASAGGQSVMTGTYNNLSIDNTSGTQTPTGSITMSNGGTLTTAAGGTLNMGTHLLAETGTATFTNNGTISSANTSATPIPTGKTWDGTVIYNAATGGQNVVTGTYNNLTLSNTSGTQTAAGNITVNGALTTTSGGTFNLASRQLLGTLTAINNSGTIITRSGSNPPIPVNKTWDGTVDFNAVAGGQRVSAGTYHILTLSNSSGTQTTTGNITVNGTLNTSAGGTLAMLTFGLQGTLNSNNSNGTITTGCGAYPPLPINKTWNGTVVYTSTTGGQSLAPGSYNNLTLLNSSGTLTTGGDITVAGTLLTTQGGIFNLGTSMLSESGTATFTNNGTITTANVSSTPLPTGKTWGGTITYDAASGGQSIVAATYTRLTMSNTSGTQSMSGSVTVDTAITVSGGKLALGSNTLTINGSMSGFSASSSLVANGSSNLVIGGSGALGSNLFFDQTTPATTNRLTNFTYNRSSQTITLGNALQVTGTVTPTAGTLATGDVLTLVSNATGTARIASGSGSYITGNVIAERYIPSVARRFRFLASPVSGSTLADWKNEIYITGSGGAANGFDATSSNAPSVYYYDESLPGNDNTNGWIAAPNINVVLTPGKGFRAFVRGDRSDASVLTGSTGAQAAVTMNAEGGVNTNNIAMPVSYTNSGNNLYDGWNLMGNPYPSAIDWNAFHDAGRTGSSNDYSGTDYAHLDAVTSIYDVNTNSYVSYNAVSNIGTGALSTGVIPSGAAFWVKAAAAAPVMTMKEVYKTAAVPAGIFKTETNKPFSLRLSKDKITADEMVVKYIAEADKNFDLYDIAKINGEVNISSITEDGKLLTGNCKPFNGNSDSIRLNIAVSQSGDYVIESFNVNALAPGKNSYLIDIFTHTVIDLNSTSKYDFSIDKDNAASFGSNRFMLVIGDLKPVETSIAETVASPGLSIYPALTHGEVTISNPKAVNETVSISIIDASGRAIQTHNNLEWNNGKIVLDLSAGRSGAYIITVQSASNNAVLKCVKYE